MADAVLAHLVSRVAPGVDVVFLDTGLHFPETLRVRDEVARTLPVNVRSIRPRLTVGQQDGQYGPRLFARSPDDCCPLRKVEPLERALADYDAWAAGLRRDESPTRANTPVVDLRRAARQGQGQPDRGAGPRPTWTPTSPRYNVPVNELFKQGYGVDRLLAVHPPHEGRRGPAGRPLGRCSRRPSAACTSDLANDDPDRPWCGRRGDSGGPGRARQSRSTGGRCHPGAGPGACRRPGRAHRCGRAGSTTPSRGRRGPARPGRWPVTVGRCWCRCC